MTARLVDVQIAVPGRARRGPLFSGVVERALDEMVLVRGFGDDGAAAREELAWRAWIEEHVAA